MDFSKYEELKSFTAKDKKILQGLERSGHANSDTVGLMIGDLLQEVEGIAGRPLERDEIDLLESMVGNVFGYALVVGGEAAQGGPRRNGCAYSRVKAYQAANDATLAEALEATGITREAYKSAGQRARKKSASKFTSAEDYRDKVVQRLEARRKKNQK